MRKTLLRAETVPQVGDMPAEPLRLRNYQKPADPMADADDEAVAAYLLDLMIAARRMAANRGIQLSRLSDRRGSGRIPAADAWPLRRRAKGHRRQALRVTPPEED